MSHRIHHDLYRAPKSLADPGNAGTIRVTQDLQICEMVTAAAETRTLANPTKAGIRLVLRLLTDGGDAVVTAANGLNVTGNTVATFEDAGEGKTRYTAVARHWTAEDAATHKQMGFHEGWGMCAAQLEELASRI